MSHPHSERILGEDGQFHPFPKRLDDRAIETGAKEAVGEANEPDPSLPRENKAQAEVKAKQIRQSKAQKEADKKSKENSNGAV